MNYEITSRDMADFVHDTAPMLAETQLQNVALSLAAAKQAGALANDVEFWRWISKNYHCLGDAQQIQAIAERSPEWMRKILQGKGYEWEFMKQQRESLCNLFARFDAGTSPTQPGIDITKTNLLTGKTLQTYQNKAYTSGQTPDLHNTPKSVPVVTNAENAGAVEEMGYHVIPFQDNQTIKAQTDKRMQQAQNGKAYTCYTPGAVIGTMAKAGLGSAVLGVGIEAIASYKRYKRREMSKEAYIKEIMRSGAISGVNGAATAGIMIPIAGLITAAGIAQPWLIPVSFVVSATLNKIIAPAFGGGEYARLLGEARYYQSLTDMHMALAAELEQSAVQFAQYIFAMNHYRQVWVAQDAVNAELNAMQQNALAELQNMQPFDALWAKIKNK